jgi:hypothetical protein
MSKLDASDTPKKGKSMRRAMSPKDRDNKSSDEALFTLVSYQRRAPARVSKPNKVSQTVKTSFQEVTKGKFHVFQKDIYPIIGKILEENSDFNTTFACNWKSGKQGTLAISENSTFRTVSKILKITQLQDYRQLIRTLPGIRECD